MNNKNKIYDDELKNVSGGETKEEKIAALTYAITQETALLWRMMQSKHVDPRALQMQKDRIQDLQNQVDALKNS